MTRSPGFRPAFAAGLLVAGFGSGELVALNPTSGAVVWSDSLAAARGRTSLADVSSVRGRAVIKDGRVYAISLGQQLAQVQVDRDMIIGTITSPPAVTIVSRRLGNVPQLKINAFEYYRTYPYRTDQWYFKDAQ